MDFKKYNSAVLIFAWFCSLHFPLVSGDHSSVQFAPLSAAEQWDSFSRNPPDQQAQGQALCSSAKMESEILCSFKTKKICRIKTKEDMKELQ